MKNNTFLRILLTVWIGMLLMTGCAGETEVSASANDEQTGIYNIYYKLSEGTGLKTKAYTAVNDSANPEALAKELMGQLKSQVADDPTVVPSLSPDLEASLLEVQPDGTLKIDFAGAVRATDAADVVLSRAAFVLTMTQIPGIEYVEISYDQIPVRDANLYTTDKLSAADFIMESDDSLYAMTKSTMVLYFPDAEGTGLKETEKSILYAGDISAERMVLQMLMDGPSDAACTAVLPKELSILAVSVKDGVCYVNFDQTFLSGAVELAPELIVYSIVNSLTALPGVTRVQILVNGKSDVLLRETLSLNNVFSANLNYILGNQPETETEEAYGETENAEASAETGTEAESIR